MQHIVEINNNALGKLRHPWRCMLCLMNNHLTMQHIENIYNNHRGEL
jgi:hypothetical protein